MRRKFILGVLLVSTVFSMTGCGEEKEMSNEKETIEETTTDTSSKSTKEDIELYSDNTKYVFEMGNTRYVFYYSGDKITAYHTYVNYESSANANAVYQTLKIENYPTVKKYYVKGKYIIFEWNESEYENMTTEDVKTAYSYMKELKK